MKMKVTCSRIEFGMKQVTYLKNTYLEKFLVSLEYFLELTMRTVILVKF